MQIDVRLDGAAVPIDESVFRLLLDNSVAGSYKDYEKALDRGHIDFTSLVELARRGEIPYPLFFAPREVVENQVEAKTKKLLQGVSKDTFSVGTRARVELCQIELIVKDLIRKQELLKRLDRSLVKNEVVGSLRRSTGTPDGDAKKLSAAIGLQDGELRSCRTKEKALDLLIDRLEESQILVSRSVQHFMPQRLANVKFSGMTIRDAKVPYIFLAGGDHGDAQEPVGRMIFTLTLMAVLIGRRVFAPMTWDGGSVGVNFSREYDIAGSILMPGECMKDLAPTTLEDMKSVSNVFNVTPSATTIRAMRLSLIDRETAESYLAELRTEYNQRKKSNVVSQPRPENAVRRYNGRELTRRMLDALDSNKISPGDFCRSVCLNKIKPHQIEDLRRAL